MARNLVWVGFILLEMATRRLTSVGLPPHLRYASRGTIEKWSGATSSKSVAAAKRALQPTHALVPGLDESDMQWCRSPRTEKE